MSVSSAAPSAVTRLREALARPGLLVVPGAYDALSAKLIEEAGFPVQFMTGFATALLIEDKINPKRLGTEGEKPVLERGEAVAKLRAAIETAHEHGILVLARTDARATRGFD